MRGKVLLASRGQWWSSHILQCTGAPRKDGPTGWLVPSPQPELITKWLGTPPGHAQTRLGPLGSAASTLSASVFLLLPFPVGPSLCCLARAEGPLGRARGPEISRTPSSAVPHGGPRCKCPPLPRRDKPIPSLRGPDQVPLPPSTSLRKPAGSVMGRPASSGALGRSWGAPRSPLSLRFRLCPV